MNNHRPVLDFLRQSDSLTETQRLIQSSVRDFVVKQALPRVRQAYREETFPLDLIPEMGALGLLGAFLKDKGLPGMDSVSYGLCMRELERADSGLRSFASVQGGLVMYPISAFGSEAQKKQWLIPLAQGQAVGCFGLTESEGGSDPSHMKTRATETPEGWVLNGSKMWITNGNLADIAVVWAQTERGIRGFLVPTKVSGFKAIKMQGKLSLRASVTSELVFDNVKLPKDALLPKTEGLKSALQCLNQARFSIVWGVLGAAEACFEEAIGFALERKVFSKSIASFQLVQRKLAIMASRITQGQLLAYRLSQLKDEGKLHHSHVSLGKQANVEIALEVARMARDILGANGIMDEYQSMRHMCNLETVSTYEGTNDIHLLVVGQELTGIPAFT